MAQNKDFKIKNGLQVGGATSLSDSLSVTGNLTISGSGTITIGGDTFNTVLDSALTTSLIDSAHVQLRQDKAYSSLTGTPTIPALGTDFVDSDQAKILIDANALDSGRATSLIDSDYIENRRPPQSIFEVTNSGGSAYVFNGDGFSSARNNPDIYLQRGKTYKFELNASGHPFQIRVSNGGSAYNTGVTNNGAQTGNVFFTPDMNAPDKLVYQCTLHSGMVGNIYIINLDTFIDSDYVAGVLPKFGTDYVDSSTVIDIINSEGLDSDLVKNLVDSAYIQLRDRFGDGDSDLVNNIIDATVNTSYVQARQTLYTNADFLDSNTVSGVVDAAYVQARQTTYTIPAFGTDYVDSGYVSGVLPKLGTDFVDSDQTLILIDANALDSARAIDLIKARGPGGDTLDVYLDSYYTTALIDSAYVQARQAAGQTTDPIFKTISVAGQDDIVAETTTDTLTVAASGDITLTTNAGSDTLTIAATVPKFGTDYVDSGYVSGVLPKLGTDFIDSTQALILIDANALDSGRATRLVDSAYVRLRETPQDFAYGSLTGAPTIPTFGVDFVDSGYVSGVLPKLGTDFVDSTQSLILIDANALDSGRAISLIDSAHVRLRETPQDFAYGSLTGAPTIPTFGVDFVDSGYVSGVLPKFGTDYIDSTTALTLIDANALDSGRAIALIDSAYIQARSEAGTDSATTIALIDSDYVRARQLSPGIINTNGTVSLGDEVTAVEVRSLIGAASAAASGGLDSAQILVFVDSAYVVNRIPQTGAQLPFRTRQYQFFSTPGQTTYTGKDMLANIDLSYETLRFNVFFNGLLLADSDYEATDGSSIVLADSADSGDIVTIVTYEAASGLDSAETLKLIDANALDSGRATSLIDSAYINARTDAGTDSSATQAMIDSSISFQVDSAYVQLRQTAQDFAYGSLTGAPTIPAFGTDYVDSGYVTSVLPKFGTDYVDSSTVVDIINSEGLDSDLVTALVDSAYIQLRDRFQDSSLVTSTVDAAYVQARQTLYTNADFLDSTTVEGVVNASYVQARQTLYTNADFLDSNTVSGVVDAAYVQARQTTYTIPTLGSDFVDSAQALILIDANALDSGRATDLIDSAYISARVGGNSLTVTYTPDAKYARLTMTSNQTSITSRVALTNFNTRYIDTSPNNALTATLADGKFIIPAGVTKVKLKASVQTNSVSGDATIGFYKNGSWVEGSTVFDCNSSGREHPAAFSAIQECVQNDYFQVNMASENSRTAESDDEITWFEIEVIEGSMLNTVITSTFSYLDSARGTSLIDSAYVQLRQDKAYSSLTGAPTIPAFGTDYVDSGYVSGVLPKFGTDYIDSTAALTLIDANALDSGRATSLIDSAYVQLRQSGGEITIQEEGSALSTAATTLNFVGSNVTASGTGTTKTITITSGSGTLDSALAIDLIDSAYIQARQQTATGGATQINNFYYTNTDSQGTTFTGADDDGNTLSYTADRLQVFLNGVLLRDSADYTATNGSSVVLTEGVDSNDLVVISAFTTGAVGTLDSALTIALIDSAYVQLRQTAQDFAYSSLTGAPTIPAFGTDYVDSGYVSGVLPKFGTDFIDSTAALTLIDANALDSARAESLIDSAYVALHSPIGKGDVDFGANKILFGNVYSAEGDLPSATTYHGMFAHVHATGAGYFAHGGNWIRLANNSDIPTQRNLGTDFVDSAETLILIDANALDSARAISLIDSAYVQARQTSGGGSGTLDSALTIALIDSAYVQLRQSGGGGAAITIQDEGSSLSTAAETINFVGAGVTASGTGTTKTITIPAAGLGSAVFNTDKVTVTEFTADSGQTAFTGLDYTAGKTQVFLNGIQLVDVSDYTATNGTSVTLLSGADSGNTVTVVSHKETAGTFSGATTITNYFYTNTDSQGTTFTGADDAGNTLAYAPGKLQVYLNGIFLKDSDDYTATSGHTVTLTQGADSDDVISIVTYITENTTGGATKITNYYYEADSGQTAFTGADDDNNILSYTADKLQVYLNGILLRDSADYTATNGSSITLIEGADSGDILTVSAFVTSATGTLDSAGVTSLIDSAYVGARVSVPTFGTDFIDSAEAIRLITLNAIDSGVALELLLDSSEVVNLIDSAYVRLRETPGLAITGGTMSGDIHMDSNSIVKLHRLGIGTATPASALHIIDSTGTYGQVRISDGASNVWQRVDSAEFRVDWFSSVNRKVNILNSGAGNVSVGIGTASPAQTLDVSGTLNVTGATTLGSTLNGHTIPGGTGTLALTSNIPTLGGSFVDSAQTLILIDANALDSGRATSLIDSAYVQLRQSGGAITVQEEGSSLSTSATTLNFVGSNVTASGTGATKTITITGGGGGVDSAGVDLLIDAKLATTDVTDFIGADGNANQVLKSLGDGNVEWTNLRIPEFTPTSSTTVGTRGEITFDSSYLYVAVATNSWNRIAWTDSSW